MTSEAISLRLGVKEIERFDQLCERWGMSRAQAMRRLIHVAEMEGYDELCLTLGVMSDLGLCGAMLPEGTSVFNHVTCDRPKGHQGKHIAHSRFLVLHWKEPCQDFNDMH